MSHEITKQDSLVLFNNAAWHGLGTVVSEAPTPTEAVKLAGLDWKIGFPSSLTSRFEDGSELPVQRTRILYRFPRNSDEQHIELYGCGLGFVPIQNEEIAEMAYSFGAEVRVESAGSLMQGKRVWFLLKGATLDIKGDQVQNYLALVNGNDGKLALGVMPTSVRIVCNNTLTQAMKSSKGRMFRIAHAGNYKSRMEECANALKQYRTVEAAFAADARALAEKEVKAEKQVAEFYSKVYASLYGTPSGDKAFKDSIETIEHWDSIMKSEMMELGIDTPSYWLMANSVTNALQHDTPDREVDGWQERRMMSNLFGDNMLNSAKVMQMALTA